jgi:hypothetical protein
LWGTEEKDEGYMVKERRRNYCCQLPCYCYLF